MSQYRNMRPFKKRRKLPQRADSWLRNCKGPTGHLIQQSQSLHILQKHLANILPEPLILHVQVMSLSQDRLALAADSAVWASQLRHRRNSILSQMGQATNRSLMQLEIKISSLYAPPVVRTIDRHLSAYAAQNLELTARVVQDPELSAALRRLSRHTSISTGSDAN